MTFLVVKVNTYRLLLPHHDLVKAFSTSLNSKHLLQFHPTVMLVAYVNSYFITSRQNFFHVSFSSTISKLYINFQSKKTKTFKKITNWQALSLNKPLQNICVTADQEFVTFVIVTNQSSVSDLYS
jgi:hypothetical protein